MSSTPHTTSVAALRAVHASGVLSAARRRAYDTLWLLGPSTGSELDRELVEPGRRPHYHKRLAELEACGVVRRLPARRCAVTGFEADVWEVIPGAVPVKPRRRPRLKPADIEAVVGVLERLLVGPGAGLVDRLIEALREHAANGRSL